MKTYALKTGILGSFVLAAGVLLSSCGIGEVRSEPARGAVGTFRCASAMILGNWRGQAATDTPSWVAVDFRFEFRPDGTYSYTAGQGNSAWVSHSGTFTIADNPDTRYPCQITIDPRSRTVDVDSKLHLTMIQSRDLMDDRRRTFLYKEFTPGLVLAGSWTDWKNDIGSFGLSRY